MALFHVKSRQEETLAPHGASRWLCFYIHQTPEFLPIMRDQERYLQAETMGYTLDRQPVNEWVCLYHNSLTAIGNPAVCWHIRES